MHGHVAGVGCGHVRRDWTARRGCRNLLILKSSLQLLYESNLGIALGDDSFELVLQGTELVVQILLSEGVLLRLMLEAVLRIFKLLCVVCMRHFRLKVVKINSAGCNLQDE